MLDQYYNKYDDFILYNADYKDALKEISDDSVDLIFADPPYFLSNNGITCQSGKMVCVNKGEWDKGGTNEYIYQFNKEWLSLCRPKLKDNASIWISGTHHNIFVVQRCLIELGYKILNIITWQKSNPSPNISCRYFTFSTEFVIWARKNHKTPHTFNYYEMKSLNGNKQMKDVWKLATVAKWEKTCGKHPTQKPLSLLYRLILASTKENDLVVDLFCGSCTTGIASNLLNRNFIGIDLEKEYLNIGKRRREEISNIDLAAKMIKKLRKTID